MSMLLLSNVSLSNVFSNEMTPPFNPYLKPERNPLLAAVLFRRELGADAIYFDVNAGVSEKRRHEPS